MSGYSGDNSSYPHAPNINLGQRNQQSHQQPQVPPFFDGLPQQQQFQQQHQQALSYEQNGPNGHGNGQPGPVYPLPPPPPPESLVKDGPASRPARLPKACDSCSVRKVKCDAEGPPCKPCKALDIPCTTSRLSKRRGPPNRHAEQIKEEAKKRKIGTPGNSAMGSYDDDAAATLAAIHAQTPGNAYSLPPPPRAEDICPLPILQLLIDDFFTYIHPLAPLPHEPSFRDAFMKREDVNNRYFLALLASMVGILVASFPRKPIQHLKAHNCEHLFPTSLSLVKQCHKVAVEARGNGFLDIELNVYDAVTSYFLGLAAAYTHEFKQCRLYFGETLTISNVLGAYKAQDPGLMSVGTLPATFGAEGGGFVGQPEPVDFIKQEIGRRVFWIMVVGVRSLQQLGASFGELFIPPQTPNNPYPPFPAEVDDEFIYPGHIAPQPQGVISKLKGFNTGIHIYMSMSNLATLEMCYGIDEVFDWNRQKKVLEDCLSKVKNVLHNLPPELELKPSSEPGQFESTDRLYYPHMTAYPGGRFNVNEMGQWSQAADDRRKVQFEIQKANIYISQLGTRSYIVERYGNLLAAFNHAQNNATGKTPTNSPGEAGRGLDKVTGHSSPISNYDDFGTNVVNEREDIIKDLLRVLGSISQINMEPNGASSIASTLIDQPQDHKGPLAVKHEEYLAKFLDILMKLERINPLRKDELGNIIDDEEEELRSWADLRDYQMKWVQSGSFLG